MNPQPFKGEGRAAELAQNTQENRMLPVLPAHQLQQQQEQARYLVESLCLANSVAIIGGSPKLGKTWLGLELAVAVASGARCLSHYAVQQPGRALIFLAEDALPLVRERLVALTSHKGLTLEALDVHVITAPRLRLDLEVDRQRLRRTLAHLKPRLLLLDPLIRMHRADENQAQEITPILDYLRELQRTLNVTVILTHHTRKNGTGPQKGQSLRGSGDLHAWLDTGLYLSHERGRLKLTIEHRAAPAPEPIHLRLEQQPLHLALCDDVRGAPPTLAERVVEVLADNSDPITRTALRQTLRVNNARLGEQLSLLEQGGQIHRTSNGYRLSG